MFQHLTVLKEEAVTGLNIVADGIYVDCTLGGAGHSELIAAQLGPKGRLIGLDQDEVAISYAQAKLSTYGERVTLLKTNFRHLAQALAELDIEQIDGFPQVNGILFDLGVSSPQFDEADRGFSYRLDARLDMRMDQSASLSAREIVNTWPEREISRILFEYGEERFARQIARNIVQARAVQPIETTGELAELIKQAIPAAARRSGPHPARRSFQAIRIAVNDELNALQEALLQSIDCLAPGGRLVVITFHSLEDRLCKQFFAKYVERCTCPSDFPQCVCGSKGRIRLVHRKPLTPSEAEIQHNPRARSAKLRIVEKI